VIRVLTRATAEPAWVCANWQKLCPAIDAGKSDCTLVRKVPTPSCSWHKANRASQNLLARPNLAFP
jgi:hypothetical protein